MDCKVTSAPAETSEKRKRKRVALNKRYSYAQHNVVKLEFLMKEACKVLSAVVDNAEAASIVEQFHRYRKDTDRMYRLSLQKKPCAAEVANG